MASYQLPGVLWLMIGLVLVQIVVVWPGAWNRATGVWKKSPPRRDNLVRSVGNALLRRAHPPDRDLEGGHATLCPPYGNAALDIDLVTQWR